MEVTPEAFNSIPFAIIIGAIIAWFGNYFVQIRIQANMRLFHNVDTLKQRLHEFVELATKYWTLDGSRSEIHTTLEAQILAKKYVIQVEYLGSAEKFRQVNKSHRETKSCRIDLWNVSTGGCFQQAHWNRDPERIRRITSEARCIVRSLNQSA